MKCPLNQHIAKHTLLKNPPTTSYNPVSSLKEEALDQWNNSTAEKSSLIFTQVRQDKTRNNCDYGLG